MKHSPSITMMYVVGCFPLTAWAGATGRWWIALGFIAIPVSRLLWLAIQRMRLSEEALLAQMVEGLPYRLISFCVVAAWVSMIGSFVFLCMLPAPIAGIRLVMLAFVSNLCLLGACSLYPEIAARRRSATS
jgi:hypothetical protein